MCEEKIANSKLHQRNFHLIPFFYKGNSRNITDKIKNYQIEITSANMGVESRKSINVWQPMELCESKLHDFVNNQFKCYSENNAYSYCFRLNNNEAVRNIFGLQKKDDELCLYYNKEILGQAVIPYIDMFIFDLNVGFLVIHLNVAAKSDDPEAFINDIISFNYHFKKFEISKYFLIPKSDESSVSSLSNKDKERYKTKKWLLRFFEPIGEVRFFNGDQPDFAYPFVSICTNSKLDDDKIKKYLYMLRHSFNNKYLPKMDIEKCCDEIFEPFENRIWGFSSEGCCGFQYDPEEAGSNLDNFYNENSSLEANYLRIVLMVLFWKYSSINLTDDLQELYIKGGSFEQEKLLELINDHREKFILFKLKSYCVDVSNTSHLNKFFQKLKYAHSIDEVIKDADDTLNLLDTKARMVQDEMNKLREKDLDEKEKNRQGTIDRMIVLVTLLFGIVQALSGVTGINALTTSMGWKLEVVLFSLGRLQITGYIIMTAILFISYISAVSFFWFKRKKQVN